VRDLALLAACFLRERHTDRLLALIAHFAAIWGPLLCVLDAAA
jgi:hypothetical protein